RAAAGAERRLRGADLSAGRARPADPLQPPDPRRRLPDQLSVLPRRRPAVAVRGAAVGGALHGLPQDRRRRWQPGSPEAPGLLAAPGADPLGAHLQGAGVRLLPASGAYPGGPRLPDVP